MTTEKTFNPLLIKPSRHLPKRLDFLPNQWHYKTFEKDVLYR